MDAGLPLNGTVSSVQPPAAPLPQSSAGDLDVFPDDVVANIFKYVMIPVRVPPVCKRIQTCVRLARSMQLNEEGIFLDRLARICHPSFVEPLCVHVLRRFDVNISAIVARPDVEVKQELQILLDGRFDLLQDPQELHNFLSARLANISQTFATTAFEHKGGLDFSSFQAKLGRFLERWARGVRYALGGKISAREMATRPIIAAMREAASDLAFQDYSALPGRKCYWTYTFHGSDTDSTTLAPDGQRALPLSMLALPPCEVLKLLQPFENRAVDIGYTSFIPVSVGLITPIDRITIFKSAATTVPEAAFYGKPREIVIRECPNLKSLSISSLGTHPSIKQFTIDSCSKELLEQVSMLSLEALTISDCSNIDVFPHPEYLTSLKTVALVRCSIPMVEQLWELELERLTILLRGGDTCLPKCLLNIRSLQNFTWVGGNESDPVFRALREKGVMVRIA